MAIMMDAANSAVGSSVNKIRAIAPAPGAARLTSFSSSSPLCPIPRLWMATSRLPMVSIAVRKLAVVEAKILPRTISSRLAGEASSGSSVCRSFSPAVMSMAGYIAPVNINSTIM